MNKLELKRREARAVAIIAAETIGTFRAAQDDLYNACPADGTIGALGEHLDANGSALLPAAKQMDSLKRLSGAGTVRQAECWRVLNSALNQRAVDPQTGKPEADPAVKNAVKASVRDAFIERANVAAEASDLAAARDIALEIRNAVKPYVDRQAAKRAAIVARALAPEEAEELAPTG